MAFSRSSFSLAQKAYEHLLEKILRNQLVPGQIINRRSIAEELGFSIAPVLEAMVQLESEGLLTTIPRKGTQVRLIRQEEIADQLVLREAIECEAARYYCGEPIRLHEAELKQLGDDVDGCTEGPVAIWKLEIAFHRKLVELADCRSLLQAFRQAMHLGTLSAMDVISNLHPNNPHGSHNQLVDRLMEPDPDHAESVMRAHLHGGKRHFFQRRTPAGGHSTVKNGALQRSPASRHASSDGTNERSGKQR